MAANSVDHFAPAAFQFASQTGNIDLDNVAKALPVEVVQVFQQFRLCHYSAMLGDLEGSPEPVEVKIFGSSSEELNKIADDLEPKIQKIEGIVDYKGPRAGNPELLINVDPTQAAHIGLTIDQVTQQLQDSLLGDSTTDLRQSDRLIPIRVRYPDSFRYQENNIRQFPIIAANKQVIPLQSIASINQTRGQNELLRENQRLMIVLTARLENRDLGGAIADVKKLMNEAKLPVGYTWEIGGQYESQQRSFHD